ncbi:MAG: DUF6585 family protein [Roseiflexaceae bacterium]
MDMHVPVVAAQLGGRIADFPWSPRARGSRWLLIGLLGGLGLLLIVMSRQAAPQVAPISLGAGALLLSIAVGTAYISFRRGTHPPQLTLYEQGVVVQRGRQVQLVRYEEIDVLWEQIMWQGGRDRPMLPSRTHVYTLRTRDRRTLRLSDQFAGIRQAGALMQQEMLRRSLPAAVAAYQVGEALSFGPLTICQAGLARKQGALPWAEVARVSIIEGRYRDSAAWTYKLQVTRIGQRRPWLEIDLQQIPNSRLLLALLKESGVALDLGPLSSPE